MPVFEDKKGTSLFGSKDLCMVGHIPEPIESGADSFKIEGKVRTALYAIAMTHAYRHAVSDYLKSPEKHTANLESHRGKIGKRTCREYTTDFFFGKPNEKVQVYDDNTYMRGYTYPGKIAAAGTKGFARSK